MRSNTPRHLLQKLKLSINFVTTLSLGLHSIFFLHLPGCVWAEVATSGVLVEQFEMCCLAVFSQTHIRAVFGYRFVLCAAAGDTCCTGDKASESETDPQRQPC